MDRSAIALMVSGIILFLIGVIMFLSFNPTYVYFSNRFYNYEPDPLTKNEFAYFNMLATTIMPMLNLLIVVGITMLLLGGILAVLRRQS